tara:strand:- start:1385 stop:2146 length:762 start_codon:yes stop_codon:yes gene_type:complete
MKKVRILARLDVKGNHLIKSISLEGLRKVGIPSNAANNYYKQGIDEIIYIDLVASLYGRSKIEELVSETAKDVFIPLTAGGGIRNIKDVKDLLRSGADKVAINTAAVNNPKLISDISSKFGNQCLVVSIEAKIKGQSKWEVYTECGRIPTGIDVIEWAKKVESLGAGEILLTSIDFEGTRKGFDLNLIHSVCNRVSIPVIASGGFGKMEHIKPVLDSGADAIAIAGGFHYELTTVDEVKEEIRKCGYEVSFNK